MERRTKYDIVSDLGRTLDENERLRCENKALRNVVAWMESDMKRRVGFGPLWEVMHEVHKGKTGLVDAVLKDIEKRTCVGLSACGGPCDDSCPCNRE